MELPNLDHKLKYYLPQAKLEQLIWEKIGAQWKSIRQAYREMLGQSSGNISRDRLRQNFQNWAIEMAEDQLEPIFQFMDVDKDGQISFLDFLHSVGKVSFHKEDLYFRQDKKAGRGGQNTCFMFGCLQVALDQSKHCELHTKILA